MVSCCPVSWTLGSIQAESTFSFWTRISDCGSSGVNRNDRPMPTRLTAWSLRISQRCVISVNPILLPFHQMSPSRGSEKNSWQSEPPKLSQWRWDVCPDGQQATGSIPRHERSVSGNWLKQNKSDVGAKLPPGCMVTARPDVFDLRSPLIRPRLSHSLCSLR